VAPLFRHDDEAPAWYVIVEFVLPDHATEDPGLVPAALLDLIMPAYAANGPAVASPARPSIGR